MRGLSSSSEELSRRRGRSESVAREAASLRAVWLETGGGETSQSGGRGRACGAACVRAACPRTPRFFGLVADACGNTRAGHPRGLSARVGVSRGALHIRCLAEAMGVRVVRVPRPSGARRCTHVRVGARAACGGAVRREGRGRAVGPRGLAAAPALAEGRALCVCASVMSSARLSCGVGPTWRRGDVIEIESRDLRCAVRVTVV